jgi:hypothetical protein
VAQLVQHTDPKPALTYFTVWSALLGAVALAVAATRRGAHVPLLVRGAATVGCLVSALIFATVIAPATPTGTWYQPWDDPWARTATTLMHGVGPALILLDFVTTPVREARPWRRTLTWTVWPLAYLVVTLGHQALGGPPVPYPFLDLAQTSTPAVLGAIAALTLVFVVVGRLLLLVASTASHRRWPAPA